MSFEYLYNLQVQEFVQQLYATNLLVSQNPAQLYRSHVQLPLPQQPGSSQETAPSPAPPPAPAALQPVEEEANEEPIFRGEKNSSKNGVYPVLVYDIPGSERCYVFQHHKKTARGDSLIYRCSGCRHQNQKFTSVLVTDDIFHKDPCRLNHNCIPLDRYKDKAERVIYESCQEIKQDKKAHRTPTQRHYSAAAKKILNMPWRKEERQKVLEKFSRNSYEDRRRSFARASSVHRRKVEMENVPEDLRKLPWGEDFLQVQTRDMHIYYSTDVISMACENGLSALIGDGVHKLNPVNTPNRMDKGQLYVIHGVVSGGIEVPLLYAVTRYKTLATYRTIFGRLREAIADDRLKIVLDFEKAAIRAAKEAFPNAEVHGCGFHLAQAWNRKAAEYGLRQYVRGPKRVRAVSRVPALTSPPVNENHPAFEPCNKFLRYLRNTWFDGTYQDMWFKWDERELRTTNAAETFHSKLRKMVSRRTHPLFEELLECLQELTILALGRLLHVQNNVRASKPLRRRDRLRRQKIDEAMDKFQREMEARNYITTVTINNYCEEMSRYVTEKTI